MSLIAFHRFLIASGIIFCLGFSAWELIRYSETGNARQLVLGFVFMVLGLALGYYLVRLAFFLGYSKPDED